MNIPDQKAIFTDIHLPIPERVDGWGMCRYSYSPVFRPQKEEQIIQAVEFANNKNLPIAIRGSGSSYGDASLNSEGVLVETTGYNKIISWDKNSAILRVQSGIDFHTLSHFALKNKMYLPITPSTMNATLGGVLAANTGGKNHHKQGAIGEHVVEFMLLTADGKIYQCNRETNVDLFYSAISGLGTLGFFLEISIQLYPLKTGTLQIKRQKQKSIENMLNSMENLADDSDYLYSWLASSGKIGRSIIYSTRWQKEMRNTNKSFSPKYQTPSSHYFGLLPKKLTWMLLYPFGNPFGIRSYHFFKYQFSREYNHRTNLFSFCFNGDKYPNLKFIFKPGSIIHYDIIIARHNALKGISEIMDTCRRKKQIPISVYIYKHRKDQFLFTRSSDGYRISLDFHNTEDTLPQLVETLQEIEEIVLANKGKFLLQNDCLLRSEILKKSLGPTTIKSYQKLKQWVDPKQLFSSDLHRRLLLKM